MLHDGKPLSVSSMACLHIAVKNGHLVVITSIAFWSKSCGIASRTLAMLKAW
jgi:hypothetical protein